MSIRVYRGQSFPLSVEDSRYNALFFTEDKSFAKRFGTELKSYTISPIKVLDLTNDAIRKQVFEIISKDYTSLQEFERFYQNGDFWQIQVDKYGFSFTPLHLIISYAKKQYDTVKMVEYYTSTITPIIYAVLTKSIVQEDNNLIEKIIRESIQLKQYFHGTNSIIPFKKFDGRMDGSGIVSNGGRKYGGAFFSDNKETAEYFTEWFILTVQIKGVKNNPSNSTSPPAVMQQAIKDNKIYVVANVLDGTAFSNVVVVPNNLLHNVTVINWEFIGDKPSYFKALNQLFRGSRKVTQATIEDFFNMTNSDLEYALSIPIFKKYFDSKEKY